MTTFIRLLEAPVVEKAVGLKAAVDALRQDSAHAGISDRVFECSPDQFEQVPGSPFAYWVSAGVRGLFVNLERFEGDGRTVKQGLATADDFRFVRAWWEVAPETMGSRWFPFAKGGEYSPFYTDIFLCVNWGNDGHEMKAWAGSLYNESHWSRILKNTHLIGRAGLTWPLRGVRFSSQAVPAGCAFSVAGKMAFAPPGELKAFLALFNSTSFDYLINTRAGKVGGVQYEVGLVQETPVPKVLSENAQLIGAWSYRAWSLKRSLDSVNETSHAFLLPPGLNDGITGLDRSSIEAELAQVQRQIDDRAFELYGIGPGDRAVIEGSGRAAAHSEDGVEGVLEEEEENDTEILDAGDNASLISWLVGVAFGRFDPQLATGERAVPFEPEPFDPLPRRSPGMWPETEALKDAPTILVDDEGHADDLTARVKRVAEQIRWQAPEDVRTWLAREFFPLHIRMYSKSRRKAPIYWQLATRSGSYSVWLYIHAFTKDTLFRVQHDYAGPKLLHEERRLESMRQEFGDKPSAAQRKRIAAQEIVVQEIRVFLEEAQRVAPLWNPDLDDGVILNFAPLWRLVPQCASWQKELKATWNELCEEKYDWSHLAMHLWPERVVPKCARDRSLAIAHGLEEVFWEENGDGKWEAREKPTRSVDELIRERTSAAVKATLDGLLKVPVAQNGRGRSRGRRASAGSA